MYKYMYNKMVKEYSKESKEELVQRIMAMDEIECSDRCFANQCQAGTTIYSINELFCALDELQKGFSYEKAVKMYEIAQNARDGWNYIVNGLSKMNDDSRCFNTLNDFKKRVTNANDDMDLI